jgi:hypothetical protein
MGPREPSGIVADTAGAAPLPRDRPARLEVALDIGEGDTES